MIGLETRDLEVGYPGGPVTRCPDFSVGRGDFVCVTGRNGAGKTALVKTLAGILAPVSGTISLTGDGPPKVSYLPQVSPMQKDFPASVMEVVRSGCQATRGLRPFYTFAERRRAERIMERLGISELATRSYRELSGGQRQKVLIARAFAAPRDLLLLDEPTNALDKDAADAFMRIIREVNSKGSAIVMVTHDPTLAKDSKTVKLM